MRTLGESKVSGVNQGNEAWRWDGYFFVFAEWGGVFSARGLFISDETTGGWFLLEV